MIREISPEVYDLVRLLLHKEEGGARQDGAKDEDCSRQDRTNEEGCCREAHVDEELTADLGETLTSIAKTYGAPKSILAPAYAKRRRKGGH